jgi:hypothetical protein
VACETGTLFILDYQGSVLFQTALPNSRWCSDPTRLAGCAQSFGSMVQPVAVDIDSNGLMDIFVQTYLAGVVRYEISGSSNPRVLWGIGKGNYARTSVAPPSVRNGLVSVPRTTTGPGGSTNPPGTGGPATNGLSEGASAGIVVGALVLCAVVVLVVILAAKRSATAAAAPATAYKAF